MDVLLLILRLALVSIFGVAGIAKLFDPAGSKKAAQDFGLPKVLAGPAASALPVVEMMIAGLLLFNQTSWFGAIGAAALLLIFTSGMLYQIAKGNAPDCHCFGQIHSEPVGVSSVVRNVVMLVPAILIISQGRTNQGFSLVNTSQDLMQFLIGIAVIVLLFMAVLVLKKISDQQNLIMRRIELLELIGGTQDTVVEREDIGHPREGLPIGALIPDFELPDINGRSVSLTQLRSEGKPILFFFLSPTCTTCRAMLPQFSHWQNVLSEKVKFVYISNGSPLDNRSKFTEDILEKVLLQKQYEVSEDLFWGKWSPMAVLVDKNGRIASFSAVGDVAIADLVSKITSAPALEEFTYFTSETTPPLAPVKVGETVPAFSLSDLAGNEIDRSFFKDKHSLLIFWSQGCSFCEEMMDEIKTWDASRNDDDVQMIIFSDGDRQPLLDLGLRSKIVIDKNFNASARLGMFSTPSAVVVNGNWRFVSETAIGSDDIWALIGKRKSQSI